MQSAVSRIIHIFSTFNIYLLRDISENVKQEKMRCYRDLIGKTGQTLSSPVAQQIAKTCVFHDSKVMLLTMNLAKNVTGNI